MAYIENAPHNPEVVGPNPTPATKNLQIGSRMAPEFFVLKAFVTARELADHIGRTRRTAGNVLKGISGPVGPLEWHGSAVNDPGQYYSLR